MTENENTEGGVVCKGVPNTRKIGKDIVSVCGRASNKRCMLLREECPYGAISIDQAADLEEENSNLINRRS